MTKLPSSTLGGTGPLVPKSMPMNSVPMLVLIKYDAGC